MLAKLLSAAAVSGSVPIVTQKLPIQTPLAFNFGDATTETAFSILGLPLNRAFQRPRGQGNIEDTVKQTCRAKTPKRL